MASREDPLREAEDVFIDAVGGAIEFWGFKRILGHVWAYLYLSEGERSAGEVVERLQLSKAAVSTALAELEHWSCVNRIRRPGERRELFVAERNVWRMVSRVFRERELRRISDALLAFERAARLFRTAAASDPTARPRAKAALAQVERLATLGKLGKSMMELALERGRADVRPLQRAEEDDA